MGILLFILKVILIVFLAVIGLTMLLLAFVLFVPIHYEVSGEIKDSFQFDLKGTVKYCLSILKMVVCYQEGQMKTELFLFGRQKKKTKQELEESVESEETEEFQTDEEVLEETEAKENKADEIETDGIEAMDAEKENDEVVDIIEETIEETVVEERTDLETEQECAEEPVTVLESETEEEKTKEEKTKIDFAFLKQEITDEQNRSVIKKLFAELKYLFRHFKFRKIKTELSFSTGNPALTGQLLGVLCMFPTFYRYEIGMMPDFEAEDIYLKGTFFAAGRVRLIHILIVALRLIFDKEVRIVIKKIMALAT